MSPELATHGEGQQPGGSVQLLAIVSRFFGQSHVRKHLTPESPTRTFPVQCFNHSKQY